MSDIDEALKAIACEAPCPECNGSGHMGDMLSTDETARLMFSSEACSICCGSGEHPTLSRIRQALEKQRVPEGRDVYVIVHSNGPDCQFVEIETEDGKGVSVPWHTHGGGMHKIGPLRLAAAPTPRDDDETT